MKKRQKATTKIILGLCIIIPFFSIQKIHAEARDASTQKTYRKTLAEGITKVKNSYGAGKTKTLITTFCTETSNQFKQRIINNILFDPQQSLFMKLLCANTDKTNRLKDDRSTNPDDKDNSYRQFDTYQD